MNTITPQPETILTWDPTPYPVQAKDYFVPGSQQAAYPPPITEIIPTKRTPDLLQSTLTTEDIPYPENPLFGFFMPITATIKDLSDDLLPGDLCKIDCVKKIWILPEQRRSFVIVMYQVNTPDEAAERVRGSLDSHIKIFGKLLHPGKISLPSFPVHSWIAASNQMEHVVSDLITFQTSHGTVVVIFTEQLAGDISVSDLPLESYYLTLEKLALLQIDKLAKNGYLK